MKHRMVTVAGCVMLVAAIGLLGWHLLIPKPLIPPSIQKQIVSTLFVPQAADAVVSRPSIKFTPNDKLLSYTVQYAGTTIVMNEQPTPEQFIDIPDVYAKLVNGLGNYSSFESAIGTIYLTMPAALAGKQAAVMNAKGTLLFAKPADSLSLDQWRRLFQDMQISTI